VTPLVCYGPQRKRTGGRRHNSPRRTSSATLKKRATLQWPAFTPPHQAKRRRSHGRLCRRRSHNTLIQAIGALQDFAQARINASRAVPVLLALKTVQSVRDVVIEALKAAPDEDKQKVLDTKVELAFGPFMLDGLFVDGTISPGSLLLLDGWFVCLQAPETSTTPKVPA
jgi:hypothetical protein